MILPWIAFSIALLALGIMGWILASHWNEMRLFKPRSLKEEQEREQRDAVIERRFERLKDDKIQPVKRVARHIGKSARDAFRRAYGRLRSLENVYRNMTRPFAAMHPSTRDRIKTHTMEARALMRDLKWADAERRFLEVLSLDPRHDEAYKGLGQIYLKQKLYPQAKETFEFLLKIKQTNDTVYAGLAEIAQAEGDLAQAEGMHLKAVGASPKQAHRHAELAEFYLSLGQPASAWSPIKRANELEPKSAKYLEQSLDIALQIGDRKEAQKRYDRLRLVIDNRAKIQSFKEKLDALNQAPASL